MSFSSKQIAVTFQLGQGNFGANGQFNTVEIDGARCQVQVERANLPLMASATIKVYGMTPNIMNTLSTLGGNPLLSGRLNQVTVSAGDAATGMTQVFKGLIQNGWQSFDEGPDSCYICQAASASLDLLKSSAPSSYPGTTDVGVILAGMCARMTPPLTLQNSGVSVKLTNPYFGGTLIDQIRSCCTSANINGEIHNGYLYIWPRNSTRPVAPYSVSPTTDLVGYPNFNGAEIIGLRTLFSPTIEFGAEINLQSSLKAASGIYYVSQMTHNLESLTPGGAWFTDMTVISKQYFIGQPGY